MMFVFLSSPPDFYLTHISLTSHSLHILITRLINGKKLIIA